MFTTEFVVGRYKDKPIKKLLHEVKDAGGEQLDRFFTVVIMIIAIVIVIVTILIVIFTVTITVTVIILADGAFPCPLEQILRTTQKALMRFRHKIG